MNTYWLVLVVLVLAVVVYIVHKVNPDSAKFIVRLIVFTFRLELSRRSSVDNGSKADDTTDSENCV